MAAEQRSPFATLLRSHRIAAGLSQERLAELSGLSVRGVSDLERGVRSAARLETLRMLADALHLDAEGRAAFFRTGHPDGGAATKPRQADGREDERVRIPLPSSAIIGRDEELETISRWLTQERYRLVTLTGPGGVGKTRLALEVARRVAPDFPDGTYVVALASVSSASRVATTTAQALGVRQNFGESLQASLRRFIGNQRVLLVMDNFEHVLPAALDVVADLLVSCPNLTVLATSRTPLRLHSEVQLAVQPLPTRVGGDAVSPEDASRIGSVQLFIMRARHVREDAALTEDNAGVVVDICHHLDGLPLAMELAAVRMKHLTPHALMRRLERRLPLLTGGDQDLPERHRTLRETIAWSYDLLPAGTQAVFRRLAVFVGGWSLDAAETVIPSEGMHGVLHQLSVLVDASLVQVTEGSGHEPRYHMLETIREFALEELEASGEGEEYRRRHARYCLALAESGAADFTDAWQRRWELDIQSNHDNIRAALSWLQEQNELRDGLRLVRSVVAFWYMEGLIGEARTWMETFLTPDLPTDVPPNELIGALRLLPELIGHDGDWPKMERILRETVAFARQQGDIEGTYKTLNMLGQTVFQQGRIRESMPFLREGMELARTHGDLRETTNQMANLAYACGQQGDLAHGERMAAECLELTRRYGAPQGFEAMITMMYQGWLAIIAGNIARARTRFGTALALSREMRAKAAEAIVLAGLGEAALAEGHLGEGLSRFREGLARGWEGDFPLSIAANMQGLVSVAIRHGRYRESACLAGYLERFANVLQILPPNVVRRYESDVSRLEAVMDEDTFHAERTRGAALTSEEIVRETHALAMSLVRQ